MSRLVVACPKCHAEAKLEFSLDKRMLRRFEDGVLVFCDVCRSYEQMRPQEVYPKLSPSVSPVSSYEALANRNSVN